MLLNILKKIEMCFCDLGTNYDIQIIVVILKMSLRFFDNNLGLFATILDYWQNYYDMLRVTHAQYELQGYCVFRFGGVHSTENGDDIEL